MRSALRIGTLVVACWAAIGCAPPQGSLASAQEAAQELNQDSRFGTSLVAMDHVAPEAKPDYSAKHRGWGSAVRIADVEVAGMKPSGVHDLEVLVHVAWYTLAQQELRSTTLKQSWKEKGGWLLVAEERLEGDYGLLGEPVVVAAPDEERPRAQFPTVHLSGSP
jgi:hypothetical protein